MGDHNILFKISELIVKELVTGISDDEKTILERWRHKTPENEVLYRKLRDTHRLSEGVTQMEAVNVRRPLEDMRMRVSGYQRRQRNIWLRRIAGIAALVLILIGGVWLFSRQQDIQKPEILQPILAGGPRAILHLGNGEVIQLDTLQQTISQGKVTVCKTDDRKLAYTSPQEEGRKPGEVVYNEIEVPRGGEFDLVLADGTVVWLNAGSRLRYPVEFTGKERKVVLEGEAYFQVKKNSESPFRVEVRSQVIEVLGTEFNVSGYKDEENVYTTLVTGKVKVAAAGRDMTLLPGEQCILKTGNGQMSKQEVDVEKIISWKKGKFILEEQTLEQIMQKLARWYDITVFYQNPGLKHKVFKGSVPRYADLQQVLDILEKTNEVYFNIQGRSVIVCE